jgi:hypothetical protein
VALTISDSELSNHRLPDCNFLLIGIPANPIAVAPASAAARSTSSRPRNGSQRSSARERIESSAKRINRRLRDVSDRGCRQHLVTHLVDRRHRCRD